MFTIGDLLPSLQLEIIRRRTKQTRKQTAQALQVSASTVYNWEKGKTKAKITLNENLPELTELEQFYLHRKIAGLTQAQVAKDLGVSRYWVILMEQGKVDGERLRKHWGLNDD